MSSWMRQTTAKRLKRDHPRHEWIRQIRVGDILARGDSLRVVRDVSHWPDGRTNVVFVIKRCSWTTRCYTVYGTNDLIQLGYRPLGKRLRLTLPIDEQISEAIGQLKITLTCCDVEGLA